MKLYVFPIAPNPTRVRLYLAEKRAAGGSPAVEEVQVTCAAASRRRRSTWPATPPASCPCSSGPTARSSPSRWPSSSTWRSSARPPLIGRTPDERACVRELERIAELAVLHPIARAVHATRSPLGFPPAPEVAAQALAALPDGLARLDAVLADGRPFLAGAHVCVADCTLAAALQFGRFGQLPLPAGYPQLAAWDHRYRARTPRRSVLSERIRVRVRAATADDLPELTRLFDGYRVFYRQPSDPAAAGRFLRERFEPRTPTSSSRRRTTGSPGFTPALPALSSVSWPASSS